MLFSRSHSWTCSRVSSVGVTSWFTSVIERCCPYRGCSGSETILFESVTQFRCATVWPIRVTLNIRKEISYVPSYKFLCSSLKLLCLKPIWSSTKCLAGAGPTRAQRRGKRWLSLTAYEERFGRSEAIMAVTESRRITRTWQLMAENISKGRLHAIRSNDVSWKGDELYLAISC